jgi:hypothetical protein
MFGCTARDADHPLLISSINWILLFRSLRAVGGAPQNNAGSVT